MHPTSDQIEQIVREVLARQAAGAPAPADCACQGAAPRPPGVPCGCRQPAAGPNAAVPATTVAATADGELWLTQNVISLEHLSGRLDGVARLYLGPKSVLTPAARDHLRQHHIAWERTSRAASGQRAAPASAAVPTAIAAAEPAGLLLLSVVPGYCPGALVAHLARRGVPVKRMAAPAGSEPISLLVEELLRRKTPGALFCQAPARAACAANRWRGVRAAAVRSAQDIANAQSELAANLLVARPDQWSWFALASILARWAQAGWPRPPAEWAGLDDPTPKG